MAVLGALVFHKHILFNSDFVEFQKKKIELLSLCKNA